MGIYAFDVGLASHDDLKQGILVACYVRVVVSSSDDVDAHLCAAQMAHAYVGNMMVTEVFMDVFPTVGGSHG